MPLESPEPGWNNDNDQFIENHFSSICQLDHFELDHVCKINYILWVAKCIRLFRTALKQLERNVSWKIMWFFVVVCVDFDRISFQNRSKLYAFHFITSDAVSITFQVTKSSITIYSNSMAFFLLLTLKWYVQIRKCCENLLFRYYSHKWVGDTMWYGL